MTNPLSSAAGCAATQEVGENQHGPKLINDAVKNCIECPVSQVSNDCGAFRMALAAECHAQHEHQMNQVQIYCDKREMAAGGALCAGRLASPAPVDLP